MKTPSAFLSASNKQRITRSRFGAAVEKLKAGRLSDPERAFGQVSVRREPGSTGVGSTRPCVISFLACSTGMRPREEPVWKLSVAGIDVHKSMLAVVIADAGREGEFQFQRRKFGTTASELRELRGWLDRQAVRRRRSWSHRAVLGSRYGRSWKATASWLVAQAHSIEPAGPQADFADAERLLRRHVAGN